MDFHAPPPQGPLCFRHQVYLMVHETGLYYWSTHSFPFFTKCNEHSWCLLQASGYEDPLLSHKVVAPAVLASRVTSTLHEMAHMPCCNLMTLNFVINMILFSVLSLNLKSLHLKIRTSYVWKISQCWWSEVWIFSKIEFRWRLCPNSCGH